jgi:formate-dependent phosphoribosylglycinamide formyltransferase (GAR transformylase)
MLWSYRRSICKIQFRNHFAYRNQNNNATLFCAPIGHRQERGDYQESWQPARISDKDLFEAQDMAVKVTEALGGAVWCRIFLSR